MYERPLNATLRQRLLEPRRFIEVVWGPRQVGKTTSVRQVLDSIGIPCHYASADSPIIQPPVWIEQQWEIARALAAARGGPVVLALDELQKIPHWSDWVKLFWDADTMAGTDVRVVILGSSPLLMRAGLDESLAGRFEVIRATHWTFAECRAAFGWGVETFVFFGGYPGAAPLADDVERWRAYINDSLIETSISRDILLMTRVDKPALLRQLFHLACEHSGRELSFTKMLGQLQDAGNTTTIAHYLRLLEGAGLVTGLQKHFAAGTVRKRGSSPKLQVMDTALMSALSFRSPPRARADSEHWGRLVESAVGAHLIARSSLEGWELLYWRDGGLEVDFVARRDDEVVGIEVKTGATASLAGLQAFSDRFRPRRTLVVGTGGLPLDAFLGGEVDLWR